jgi:hypothetical protein
LYCLRGGQLWAQSSQDTRQVLPTNAHTEVLSKPSLPVEKREDALEFSADHVQASLVESWLKLQGAVCLRYQRYTVRADELHVVRKKDGTVEIQGPARIRFCPCDNPLFSFGINRLVWYPSGQSKWLGTKLYIGNVPVFYWPWMLVRTREQVGFLPPSVAWRAQDGLRIGAGVHLPLGKQHYFDITPSWYVKGGSRVQGRLQGEHHHTSVVIDHRTDTMTSVQSQGDIAFGHTGIAWNIDSLRGKRTLVAESSVDRVATVFDRYELSWVSSGKLGTVGWGARGASRRAGEQGGGGPRIAWGWGTSVGTHSVVGWQTDASFFANDQGELSYLSRMDGDWQSHASLGIVRINLSERIGGSWQSFAEHQFRDVFAQSGLAIGIPFKKTMRHGQVHRVEPVLELTDTIADSSGEGFDNLGRALPENSGHRMQMIGSIQQSWMAQGGKRGTQGTLNLGTGPGWRSGVRQWLQVVDGQWDSGWLVGRQRLAWITNSQTSGWFTETSVKIGDLGVTEAGVTMVGSDGVQPAEARGFLSHRSALTSSGWLNSPGWSFRLNGKLTWAHNWELWWRADVDASTRRYLGEEVRLKYQNSCRCWAVGAWVGRRLGRDGVDALLTLDLAP